MRSVTSLLSDTIKIFSSNFKRYTSIVIVPALLSVAVTFFVKAANPDTTFLPFEVMVAMVLTSIVFIFMSIALIFAIDDPSLQPLDAYKKAAHYFFRYLLYSIVLGFILFLAYLLLIIPGIYLTIAFMFGVYFIVLENKSIKEALVGSKDLVKGHWWGVFGRCLFLVLISILFFSGIEFVAMIINAATSLTIGYLVTDIVATITMPVGVIYMYGLYRDLKHTKSMTPIAADAPATVGSV